MPDYRYLAVSADGKRVKAKVEATDFDTAKKIIKSQGLTLIELNKINILNKEINIGMSKTPKAREIAVFCRQMSSIMKAGLSISQALALVTEQTSNKMLKEALRDISLRVEKGDTLAYAMKANGKVFPEMVIGLVQAGEESGSLEVSFNRMALNFEKKAKITGMIRKSMIYPAVVIIVAFLVVIAMSIFVVPKFAIMFTDMGSELPLMTRIIMSISNLLIHWWFLILGILFFLILLIKTWLSTKSGRQIWEKFSLKAILIGKINTKSNCANFARTLSTLIGSGMDLPRALEITANSMNNTLFKDAIFYAKSEVEQGALLSESIRKSKMFPSMISDMIGIGEETGNIDVLLTKVADYYEEETEMAASSLTAAMEPLIIVVLGIIVGFIVMALYQPMISIYEHMGNI